MNLHNVDDMKENYQRGNIKVKMFMKHKVRSKRTLPRGEFILFVPFPRQLNWDSIVLKNVIASLKGFVSSLWYLVISRTRPPSKQSMYDRECSSFQYS